MPIRQILASELFLCRPTQTRYPAAPEGWVLLTRDGEQVTGAQLPAVCDAISRAWARSNQGQEALESARDWLAVARAAAPADRDELAELSPEEAKKALTDAGKLYR